VTDAIMVCVFRFFPSLKKVEFSAQDLEIGKNYTPLVTNGKSFFKKGVTVNKLQ